MSKYSFFENSLLADSFSNLPFLITPIKLNSFKGICDLVIRLFNFISTFFEKFLNKLVLLSLDICLSK